jgi:Winged helix DNA-binding domain
MMASGDLARRRLVSQRIAGDPGQTVEQAAATMLATQAQDFAAAKWALGLRSTGLESDVDSALASGRVIRTWPMRGTLLMTARRDARWLTELLAPRSYVAARSLWQRAGLTESHFERAAGVARDELSGGRAVGRRPLFDALQRAGLDTSAERGSFVLRRLAGDTVIALGPPRGTEQTFVLLDEWAPDAVRLDRDEALAELARRYFAGHGPASAYDLAWWSGLTLTDVRAAIALAGDTLEPLDDGLLQATERPGGDLPRRGDVRLLPGFDELLLGYRDRSASLAADKASLVAPSSNGRFLPLLTIDGRVAGTWSRTVPRSGPVAVTVDAVLPLSPTTRAALGRRARAYGRFLGREVGLSFVG